MARDLLFGTTPRDWSCGAGLLLWPSRAERRRAADDVVASREVRALSDTVDREVRETYAEVARLSSAGKLTPAERRNFKPILQEWQSLKASRPDGFQARDYVALTNTRDAARSYRAKLAKVALRASPSEDARATSPGKKIPVGKIALAAVAAGVALRFSMRKETR